MTAADAITAFSALIAALGFLFGIAAWKREFVGKRRIELAEEALTLAYEVQDFLSSVRSPFSYESEGKTRERSPDELPEDSAALDRAYVAIARVRVGESLLARFRAMKYRFKAAFGPEAGKPFEEIHYVVALIITSAQQLGSYYWKIRRRELEADEDERHRAERERHESIFWGLGDDKDEIHKRVLNVVVSLERYANEANRK